MSDEGHTLTHEWVSGRYPNESKLHCVKCEMDKAYAWWKGEPEGGACYWVKLDTNGDFESACESCRRCDCADGPHGERAMRHIAGECVGLLHDIYYNERTSMLICEACYTALDL